MLTIFRALTSVFIVLSFASPALAGRSLSHPIDLSKEMIRRVPQKKPVRLPLRSELKTSNIVHDWKLWQEPSKPVVNERAFRRSQPIPLFNERTGQIGRMTGTIQLKLKHVSNFSSILAEHKLSKLDSFPDLGVFFVTASADVFDLPALVEQLKADDRIQSVNVEVVSRIYEKL